MKKERNIPGFQDKYEMDLSGNVWSKERLVKRKDGSESLRKRKKVRVQRTKNGYEYVQLYDLEKRVSMTIRKLLRLTFKIK